ncbi:MAG: hypothetical protein ACREL5_07900 [Gemmatimonadales bacterium]
MVSIDRRGEIRVVPHTLLWLAGFLAMVPFLSPSSRPGAVESRLILAGIGMAAFVQGAGTLGLGDLRLLSGQSPSDAWFVGITSGAIITGGCLLPPLRDWRGWLPVLPLAIALGFVALPHAAVGVLVGAGFGALPWLISMALPRPRRTAWSDTPEPGARTPEPRHPLPRSAWVAAALAIVLAVAGPMVLASLALLIAAWFGWWSADRRGLASVPVLPVIATVALVAWNWLALTVAGSPLATAAALARDAPIPVAGQQLLAAMAIGWALSLAVPWPLDHFGRVTVQLPALAVVLAVAVRSMPEGMPAWQPIVTPVVAAVALVAAFRRRWDAAAGALVVLGATRPGALAVTGAVVVALVPIGSRVARWPRIWTVVAGAATAMVLSATLRDEVLVTVVLGLGVAAAAQYADRVIAPI